MKNYLAILLTLFLLASCTSNSIYEKPKDLISKDTMALLLKDLYLAAAAKNVRNKLSQRRFSYVPLVYEKYKIDSTRFQASNLYYTSKIDIYDPLFDQVLKSLEADRAIFSRQKKVKDSIRQDSIRKSRKRMMKGKQPNFKMDEEVRKKKLENKKKLKKQ